MIDMDKIEIRFGHRVKEIRVKQNISQEEQEIFLCGQLKRLLMVLLLVLRNYLSLSSILIN